MRISDWSSDVCSSDLPPHDINQRFIDFADRLLERPLDRKLFHRMAGLSGIDHRYSFLAPAGADDDDAADCEGFYRLGQFPGTAARMIQIGALGMALCQPAAAVLAQHAPDQNRNPSMNVSF